MQDNSKRKQARIIDFSVFLARAEYQRRKQQPTQNIHGVHVGDLSYDSWGYDQTNVDFYQVVELRGKATAIIREIEGDYGAEGYGWTGTVQPVRDGFRNDKTYAKRTSTGYDGQPNITSPKLKGRHLTPTQDDRRHDYSSYC